MSDYRPTHDHNAACHLPNEPQERTKKLSPKEEMEALMAEWNKEKQEVQKEREKGLVKDKEKAENVSCAAGQPRG